MKKFNFDILTLFSIILVAAVIFGEIRCIYKAVSCNWEPIGKAEVIYTTGAFTGLGVIIGYFNIEDK
jgi:hypothetical protein